MDEIWKDIVGKENKYQISSKGQVKSLDRIVPHKNRWGTITNLTIKSKILKNSKYPNGYLYVRFEQKGKTYLIHRLVAEAFIPNPHNLPCVDHINGNRQDNRVENLRWCTHKDNSNFEIAKERMINAQSKKIIYQYDFKTKELIAVYESINEAARQTGYLLSNIWMCAAHYGRLKTYKGYIWSFEPL